MPQPTKPLPTKSSPSQFVELSESAATLRTLLSLVYPVPFDIPEATSLVYLWELLRISEKYELKIAAARIASYLITRADKNCALELYAIGSTFGLENLIRQSVESA